MQAKHHHNTNLMSQVSSNAILDRAFAHVRQGRACDCPHSDIWSLLLNWINGRRRGGLMLKSLDESIPADCAYVRYMDDWVILIKTRQQLRRVVKRMHAIMHRLKFKLAKDKTFIGRISSGFDFLGHRFNHRGLVGLAKKTVLNFIGRVSQLYEQGASSRRIADYVRRWIIWCRSGLQPTR
jgi:hypothetical protein